jgi:class 3 adenylate cyclase
MQIPSFIQNWLKPNQKLDPASERIFMIATVTIPLALIIHFLYIPLFYWMGLPVLVFYNVVSSGAWLLVLHLVRRVRFNEAWCVFSTEILIQAILCVQYAGWAFGNQYYLFTLVGISFLLPNNSKLSLTIAVLAILEFGLLALWANDAPTNLTTPFMFTCRVVNSCCAFAILLFIETFHQKIILETEQKLGAAMATNEELLQNVFPNKILETLKDQKGIIAERFESATVLFADIVNFTPLSEKLSAIEIVYLLDKLFSSFDGLVRKHGLEKIKTIGDAYMVASGVPVRVENHAELMADFALEFMAYLKQFNRENNLSLQMRIGINSGPVVAGVIGKWKFLYDLWGDCVNTAARMEGHGIPGEIQITETTRALICDQFEIVERGIMEIKGKGPMKTYLLKGRKGNTIA